VGKRWNSTVINIDVFSGSVCPSEVPEFILVCGRLSPASLCCFIRGVERRARVDSRREGPLSSVVCNCIDHTAIKLSLFATCTPTVRAIYWPEARPNWCMHRLWWLTWIINLVYNEKRSGRSGNWSCPLLSVINQPTEAIRHWPDNPAVRSPGTRAVRLFFFLEITNSTKFVVTFPLTLYLRRYKLLGILHDHFLITVKNNSIFKHNMYKLSLHAVVQHFCRVILSST